jgi:hypothetical protein
LEARDEQVENKNAIGVQVPPAPLDLIGAKVEYRPTSLIFRDTLTFDEWATLGKFLYQLTGAIFWWIADWINYGDSVYGETYTQAIEETGLSYQTLANMAYVGRAIPPERRRELLSPSHHALVAALPADEQEAALEQAEQEGWTCRELAEYLGRGVGGKLVLFEGSGRATEVLRALMRSIEAWAHDEVKVIVERKREVKDE